MGGDGIGGEMMQALSCATTGPINAVDPTPTNPSGKATDEVTGKLVGGDNKALLVRRYSKVGYRKTPGEAFISFPNDIGFSKVPLQQRPFTPIRIKMWLKA